MWRALGLAALLVATAYVFDQTPYGTVLTVSMFQLALGLAFVAAHCVTGFILVSRYGAGQPRKILLPPWFPRPAPSVFPLSLTYVHSLIDFFLVVFSWVIVVPLITLVWFLAVPCCWFGHSGFLSIWHRISMCSIGFCFVC